MSEVLNIKTVFDYSGVSYLKWRINSSLLKTIHQSLYVMFFSTTFLFFSHFHSADTDVNLFPPMQN